jgi:hypothetical protein
VLGLVEVHVPVLALLDGFDQGVMVGLERDAAPAVVVVVRGVDRHQLNVAVEREHAVTRSATSGS